MLSTRLRSNLDTILFVVEAYGERLNRPTLIHTVMQIDLDHSPDCNSSGHIAGSGRPLWGRWRGRVPSYPWWCWNLPRLRTHLASRRAYGVQLGSNDCVQYSLQEKLYLPTIRKSLREVLREEWIWLRFQTFAVLVVNNKSLLIPLQLKSLPWPKTSIDRKLRILVT